MVVLVIIVIIVIVTAVGATVVLRPIFVKIKILCFDKNMGENN